MAVSATRRDYEVTLAFPNQEWHQFVIPATSVPRAISKAYKAAEEKWPGIGRGNVGIFSVVPTAKQTGKDAGEPNWPTIRAKADFEMPEVAVEEHEFDVEYDEE